MMFIRPVHFAAFVSLAAWAFTLAAAGLPLFADPSDDKPVQFSPEETEFFEKRVRPILVEKCYRCHSAEAKKLKGDLHLDSRQGVAAGGEHGKVIAGRDPDQSRLIQAVRWTDADLQMPPKEKLSDSQIAALERWVKMGAPDPRDGAVNAKPGAAKPIDLEQGRKWWAFQPVEPRDVTVNDDERWIRNKVDRFVLAKLQAHHLKPSPAADPALLIQRAYLDLIGLRPTYEQVQAFVKDDSPEAYARVIDQLLDSPQYGERWGRHWLDVVRYGETQFTGEATTPPFPFAWRYRDWVIQAINKDVPYDRFVKLQLAADLIPGTARPDYVALGFLGAAPGYHKDGRLSKEVVETLYTDDWDERLDTVTRGFLGLTVACARCHDHKFDPISTADYYSLAGVFASTVQSPRPLAEIDPDAETKFMVDTQRIFYHSYVANLLRDDPGSKVDEARRKVVRYTAEMERIKEENAGLRASHPSMYAYLSRLAKRPSPYPGEPRIQDADRPNGNTGRGRRGGLPEMLFHAVYDAGFRVDGSDPDFTMIDIQPGKPRDLHVLQGGSVAKPGAIAPRGFLSVLSKGDPRFHEGSGRRELAQRIFGDAAPLSSRVMVNRVWGWHFGKPLVGTPSDFGAQGDLPTHPELLDDLSARFIQNGYSLKWLHRQIMLSATYRQASRPRDDAARVDPANHLLWRMNPRRLDIEAYRDSLLQASGSLDKRMSGPSQDLDQSDNRRRTVYGRLSRERVSKVLQLYDFPPPTMHSPQRETTISPLQQLFVMNSGFAQDRAGDLANLVQQESDDTARIRALYRRLLSRDPNDAEIQLGLRYLETATLGNYAQALLATNEVIFWP